MLLSFLSVFGICASVEYAGSEFPGVGLAQFYANLCSGSDVPSLLALVHFLHSHELQETWGHLSLLQQCVPRTLHNTEHSLSTELVGLLNEERNEQQPKYLTNTTFP